MLALTESAQQAGLGFAATLQARPDLVNVLRATREEIGLVARKALDWAVRQARPTEAVVGAGMDNLAQRRSEARRAMAEAEAQAALEGLCAKSS